MNLQQKALLATTYRGEFEMTGATSRSQTAEKSGINFLASPKFHPYALIFGCTTVLSLGIAIECRSIAHLPSLLYGCLYWEWWGFIVAGLWGLGIRGGFCL